MPASPTLVAVVTNITTLMNTPNILSWSAVCSGLLRGVVPILRRGICVLKSMRSEGRAYNHNYQQQWCSVYAYHTLCFTLAGEVSWDEDQAFRLKEQMCLDHAHRHGRCWAQFWWGRPGVESYHAVHTKLGCTGDTECPSTSWLQNLTLLWATLMWHRAPKTMLDLRSCCKPCMALIITCCCGHWYACDKLLSGGSPHI